MQNLTRRGFDLGPPPINHYVSNTPRHEWLNGMPVKLTGICATNIKAHDEHISATEALVINILEGHSADDLLQSAPYRERLISRFESLGSAYNEGDDQEIETVLFDSIVINGSPAEDLWMKISWLSFYEDDVSLRFRFSFGVDLEEDVAADPTRQNAAAELAEVVFPESKIISSNTPLRELIKTVMNINEPEFVERIFYFNAPNGGAYLHHDLERGHAGVVYAQISGATLWLALPQQELVNEIRQFLEQAPLPNSLSSTQKNSLYALQKNKDLIGPSLNSFAHDGLIALINETQEFVQYLITKGHYRILNAGDAILLPQQNSQMCCWHSVFCLGEEMGQALSFAVK